MRKALQSIAKKFTESDLEAILRFKRMGGEKLERLQRKREKAAASLAEIDRQIAELTDGAAPKRRGRKPGAGKAKAAPAAKSAARKGGRKASAVKGGTRRGTKKRRVNLSAAVREVFARVDSPLKASQVVDGLPDVGVKVADVAAMRKRISIVLASQKKNFESVGRGVYELKKQ